MLPFFFGPPERRLFGTFHPARATSATPTALLLCNPYGQEAVRVHRLFRVLAERVARQGVDVLRFDYYGTGDAAGDDTEGDLDGWARDVVAADEELRRRARAGSVVWLGARLGAAVAARATLLTARPPERLVLWEPVVDGTAYLHALANATVDSIQSSLSIADPRWDELLARNAPELEHEGVGFEVGERLRGQLRELAPEGLAAPRAGRVDVLRRAGRPDADTVVRRWQRSGGSIAETPLADDFDWLTEEALNSALVPAGIVERLGLAVGGPA